MGGPTDVVVSKHYMSPRSLCLANLTVKPGLCCGWGSWEAHAYMCASPVARIVFTWFCRNEADIQGQSIGVKKVSNSEKGTGSRLAGILVRIHRPVVPHRMPSCGKNGFKPLMLVSMLEEEGHWLRLFMRKKSRMKLCVGKCIKSCQSTFSR